MYMVEFGTLKRTWWNAHHGGMLAEEQTTPYDVEGFTTRTEKGIMEGVWKELSKEIPFLKEISPDTLFENYFKNGEIWIQVFTDCEENLCRHGEYASIYTMPLKIQKTQIMENYEFGKFK